MHLACSACFRKIRNILIAAALLRRWHSGPAMQAVEEAALKLGLVSAEEGEVGDGNGGAYEDHRWRCITLTPHGRHWRRVIQGIVGRLSDQEATGTPQGKGGAFPYLPPPSPGPLANHAPSQKKVKQYRYVLLIYRVAST